jgi:DHA2 family multidrug resistance protein
MRLMSRASSLTNVSRQVFGSFGVALFVTILQSRMTHHTAVLSQSATSDNLPLLQVLSAAQAYIVQQGGTIEQGQLVGIMAVFQKLQLSGAVMAFDDVFRVAAAVTLIAIIPAIFFNAPRAPKTPGQSHAAMME